MADQTQAPAPQPGTPEYDAAMAAKVDDAAKKAAEAAGADAPADTPKEPPADTPKEPSEDDAKKAAESAGIDYSKLQDEYAEKGSLSEESIAALEKAGFPKEAVDSFIAGQEARAELRIMYAAEAAGGRDALTKMQEWAVKAFSAAEAEAFNKAVVGSQEDMLKAVSGLRSRYEAEYGKPPTLLGGNHAQGSVGYASKAEMTADMRDARYDKDPAFRAKVQAKLAATTAF